MALRRKRTDEDTAAPPKKQGRVAQIRSAYTMTRKVDRMVGWVTLAAGFLPFAVSLAIGLLIDHPVYLGVIGVFTGVLAATIVFGKRAEKAAFAQVDGQPGAAAAALNMLRRGWTVTPGVAVSRNQDIVHRAVGRPGVVLVAEGSASRLSSLLATEKKKVARFVPDVPVYDLQAGNETGQVPLRKLNRHLMKLPRNLTGKDVNALDKRLGALMARPQMPKGATVGTSTSGGASGLAAASGSGAA